jgi:anti-anti-sigma factor
MIWDNFSREQHDLVTHHIENGCHVLRVIAEIDVYEAARFEAEVAKAADASRVVVDLTACRFMDSSGFHVLWRASNSYGERLRIVTKPGSIPDRALRVLKIDARVQMFTSLDDARTSTR